MMPVVGGSLSGAPQRHGLDPGNSEGVGGGGGARRGRGRAGKAVVSAGGRLQPDSVERV